MPRMFFSLNFARAINWFAALVFLPAVGTTFVIGHKGIESQTKRRSLLLKRTFAILLSGMLIAAALGVHSTQAQTGQNAQSGEPARTHVARLGVGEKARVEVKLRDNRKVKGYVNAAGVDSFTITDQKTGASQTIAYADVATVKKPGSGLKARTWIIIGAAAAAAIVIGIIVKPALCDGC